MTKQKKLLADDAQEFQGDPLHPNLAYGPLEDRGCRDIFFCVLFTLFWAGLIIIAGVAVNSGDPARLASPFDSSGNQCGYGEAEQYPYMFFSGSVSTISSSIYACVEKCPTNSQMSVNCLTNKSVNSCSQLSLYDSVTCKIDDQSNPFVTLFPAFTLFFSRVLVITICIPTSSTLSDSLRSQIDIGTVEEWMSDIKATWPISLAVAFIAFGLSFIFLILMRFFAGFVTWSMIFGYFAALITLGILCLHKASTGNLSDVPSSFQNTKTIEAVGYILLVAAGISLLLFICLFHKIQRAVAIMKAASDFTRDVWQTFIVPIVMFLLIGAFFSFWIVISLYIFSSGEVVVNPYSPFGSVNWDEGVKRCLVYFLFGLFWNVEFFIGMSQLIIASSAAMWYFSHRPNAVLHSPVSKSICRAFTYHIGSVCFGSLVLSVVMLIKFLVELLYNQMKKNLNQNAAANCCVRCCLCYVKYFEDFIRFLNTNAYIMIGLTGEGFCTSAKHAFFLIARNAAQFSITHGIGKIFVLFGKLFICIFSTLIGYFIITGVSKYSDKIYSAGAPTVLFVIISFCIASVFMNIYGMAADTLLMCLCTDKELNKGRAVACPKAIQKFEEDHMKK